MKELISISAAITDIYEMSDKQFAFARLARCVKNAVSDLNIYSNALIGVKSDVVVVDSNLCAILPKDCSAVTKVGKLDGLGRCYILDRTKVVLNKQQYALREQRTTPCVNCVCGLSQATAEILVPSNLLLAEDSQSTGIDIAISNNFDNYCASSTFYNPVGLASPYIYGVYKRNYGQYQFDEANNQLLLSGIMIGDELLVEYKTFTNAEGLQLIPKAAFDVILQKTLCYLEPNNQKHDFDYKRAKRRFDLLDVRDRSASLEELSRVGLNWNV